MDEKERINKDVAYYINWMFLKELYKSGEFELERLEKVNEANAHRFNCSVIEIADK